MKVESSILILCLKCPKNLVKIDMAKGKEQRLIAYMIIIPITMVMLQNRERSGGLRKREEEI